MTRRYKGEGSYLTEASLEELREEVRKVGCPYCPAKPGEPCLGVPRKDGNRRPRTTNHVERVYQYKKINY